MIDVVPESDEESTSDVASEAEVDATPERVGPPRPGLLATVLAVIFFASATALFLGFFAFGLSGLQEQRSQHLLYAEFRGLVDPASTVAPSVGGAIPPGTPVALLSAPGAGLHDVMVVEGTSSGDLLAGPGHLRDTPLPGQVGESVVIGKSTTAGGPFRNIGKLRKGDVISVLTGQGQFHYVVVGPLAAGARPVSVPSNSGVLVLGTAAVAGESGITANGLIYVQARLKGTAKRVPPGQPKSVPTSELPSHADLDAWPLAALWLFVLALASAFTWWLWARWGLFRTWIIGAPILLGIMWGLGNAGLRLFPNVY